MDKTKVSKEDDDGDFEDADEFDGEEAEDDTDVEPEDYVDIEDQKISGLYITEDGVVRVRLNLVATLNTQDKKTKRWNYARDIHATLELKVRIENDDHYSKHILGVDDHNSRFEIEPLSLEITQLAIRNDKNIDLVEQAMINGMKAVV